MRKRSNVFKLSPIFLLALPAFSHAGSVSFDYLDETLKSGEHWQVTGAGVSGVLAESSQLKGALRLENEHRSAGSTQRLFISGSAPVGASTVLELGLAKGSGASYGFQSQQQLTAYTNFGPVETSIGVSQTDYASSTTRSYSIDARLPVQASWIVVSGARSGQSAGRQVGHFYKLGVEKELSGCTVSLTGYTGSEARDAANPALGTLNSNTTLVGARCAVNSRMSVALKASRTVADTLTRNGVSLSVSAVF